RGSRARSKRPLEWKRRPRSPIRLPSRLPSRRAGPAHRARRHRPHGRPEDAVARAKAARTTAGGAETSTQPAPRAKKRKSAGVVQTKLVGMADVVIAAAQRAKDPAFAIPIRALSNVSFNERKGMIEMGRKKQERTFFNVGMAKKFMQTML